MPIIVNVPLTIGVFNRNDSIRTYREGRASHDFDCLARADFARKDVPGTYFPDDVQVSGKVHAAHGETVPHGPRQGGVVPVGGNGFGQDAPPGQLSAKNVRCASTAVESAFLTSVNATTAC